MYHGASLDGSIGNSEFDLFLDVDKVAILNEFGFNILCFVSLVKMKVPTRAVALREHFTGKLVPTNFKN